MAVSLLAGPHVHAQSRRPGGLQPLRPNAGGSPGTVVRAGGNERTNSNSTRIARVSAEETVETSSAEDLGPANAAVDQEQVVDGENGERAVVEGGAEVGEGEASGGMIAEGSDASESDASDGSGDAKAGSPIPLTPRVPAREYAPEKRIPRVFSAPKSGSRTAQRSPAAGSRPTNSVLSNRDESAEDGAMSADDSVPPSGGRNGAGNRVGNSDSPSGDESGHRFADAPELFSEPWAEPLHGRMGCWWVTGEYLMWWRKGVNLPTMASTGPLDQPGVSILYGDQTVGDQARPGGRLSFGWAGGPHQRQGWFARVYFMETAASDFSENSTDVPGLARPFLDLSGTTPEPNAVNVDSLHVRTESDFVGGDILMRQMIHLSPLARVDFLLGYQFARIDESLQIDSLANNVFALTDEFSTANEFHGGALGLQFVYDRPGVRLDMLAKVGLGSMQQEIVLAGSSSSDPRAGLLVQASNRGRYSQSEFMAIPEFGATMTWAVSPSVEFSLGYSFLYFPGVVQAASGIDSQLAVNLNPNSTRPRFTFHDSEYWVHGLNLGLTWRY